MGIAAIGNWLFNFAIGLFIPPAFVNIKWGLFLVFGILCFMAAVQFFFTYPEVSQSKTPALNVANSSDRLVVRLLRKLNSCLAKTAHTLGRLRKAAPISSATSKTLQLREPREMLLPLSRISQRRKRARLRLLRRSRRSEVCSCQINITRSVIFGLLATNQIVALEIHFTARLLNANSRLQPAVSKREPWTLSHPATKPSLT
jgi:hypothetical protein